MVPELQQVSNTILMSVGTLISLMLMINAYFTRKTLEKINDVDVKLAIIITDHDNTKELAEKNEKDLKEYKEHAALERGEVMKYISGMRERLSVLESKQD